MNSKTSSDARKITYAELVRRLSDPDVPEESLLPYFVAERGDTRGMVPILKLNDALISSGDQQSQYYRSQGDLGLGFLNHVYASRRRRRFRKNLRRGDQRPILLAEGDSWFQYPLWLKDVIDYLSADYNIMCLSAAGDELSEMIEDGDYWDYLEALSDQGHPIRALLLSGGGNDIVGDPLVDLLNDYDPHGSAATHLNESNVSEMFAEIEAGYIGIIERVRSRFSDLPVVVHGYDYARPLPDQGFKIPPLDGWLGEPMRRKGIPDGPLQAEIIKLLIDRINLVLEQLAGREGVHFVDNRDVVASDWHDELHPKDEGFKRVAAKFRDALEGLGI